MHEPAFWHRPSSWQSRLLSPLSMLYGAVSARRMAQEGIDAGVPVICVGNFHVGGAGKTPTVLALAGLLRELGERPVVLSRGYGGRLRGPAVVEPAHHVAADVGDEPLMMASRLPVVVARNRAEGIDLARAQGASIILMDDGFQNPSITKDLALIVIDSARGLGNAMVFPAGPLRAPLPPQLARTDALVVVGDGHAADAVASRVAAAGKPVFTARLQPEAQVISALAGKPLLAFAGIGDPQRFFRTLRACGLEVAAERAFPDHHPFSAGDLAMLSGQASREGLTLVTTEKDLARLRGTAPASEVAGIAPFPVTLQFEDLANLRGFVAGRVAAARSEGRRPARLSP